MVTPNGMFLDSSNKLWVADSFKPGIEAFDATANGNVAPLVKINGLLTTLSFPSNVFVDASGNIYVADAFATTPRIDMFASGASGNVAPTRVIGSASFTTPFGVAVDSSNVYVADSTHNSIFVFPVGTNSLAAIPSRTINGVATHLSEPRSLSL
jgi:DNA-binding beta-propeller fold protein YncE